MFSLAMMHRSPKGETINLGYDGDSNQRRESRLLPLGGDVYDCLPSDDIDSILRPWLKERYVEARVLFDVAMGIQVSRIRVMIHEKLAKLRWLFVPAFTRHHWASALVWLDNDNHPFVDIYDSAPSTVTARDFSRLFASLGLP